MDVSDFIKGLKTKANRKAKFSTNGTEVASLPEIYYYGATREYWAKGKQGNWLPGGVEDVRRRLKKAGLSTSNPEGRDGRRLSDIDEAILFIQDQKEVQWVGSLAGYKSGVYEMGGNRILVRSSPNLIQPNAGDFTMLDGLLVNALGDEQKSYFDGWLRIAVKALYAYSPRVGQALVLVGKRDSGKSLVQNLISLILGGRSADPYRYMSKGSEFNGDLFGAEHLMVEDKMVDNSFKARQKFGSQIKEIAATEHHSAHAKRKDAIDLTPFWRLTISANDEPEKLLILPPMDDDLIDKIIILKFDKHPMPMPTANGAERKAFWSALMQELPYYIFYLLNSQVPSELVSDRYGVTHYHHPEIMDQLYQLTPEFALVELFRAADIEYWEGGARELEIKLFNNENTKRRAQQLLDYAPNLVTYLKRLHDKKPGIVGYRRAASGGIWTITSPSNDARE
jgi:Family of unknown function (DUF5906)